MLQLRSAIEGRENSVLIDAALNEAINCRSSSQPVKWSAGALALTHAEVGGTLSLRDRVVLKNVF